MDINQMDVARRLAEHLYGITSSAKNGAISMYQIEEAEFVLREWWGLVGRGN